MKSRAFTRVHLLSAYWSAAVHDYEHGGLNNDFLIKTAHPLAITYNDISPLENHHLSAAIRLLFTSECAYIPVSLCCTCKLFEHFAVHCLSSGICTRVLLQQNGIASCLSVCEGFT